MKSKDKKKFRITLKRIIYFAFIAIIWCDVYIFYSLYVPKSEVYAKQEKYVETSAKQENIKISQVENIDIDKIIEQNAEDVKAEEYRSEEVVLEYLTEYVNNPELATGESYVVQEGVKGVQKLTYRKVYENGEEKGEEQISATVVKAAFNQVIEIGTGSKKTIKSAKVGSEVHVTSDELTVYEEPNQESKKLAKLKREDTLIIKKIQNDWYYITYNNVQGWITKNATKYIPPVELPAPSTNTGNPTELDFNMKLNKPSGLSLEQFQKILTDSKDKNKVFQENAQYFYYIEQQYNINGLFVAAIGIHESAWGTSTIAKNKKNLFGYGAYDSNPYNGAYQFTSYSESIDLLARVLVKYYLNPKGTSIYNGETAAGTYYNGPTLTGVNTRYATDKNWANGVFAHMKYLYGKL